MTMIDRVEAEDVVRALTGGETVGEGKSLVVRGGQWVGGLPFGEMLDIGDVTGAKTLDLTDAPIQKIKLTGNTTLTLVGFEEGYSYFIIVENGGSFTLTWPSTVKWALGTAHVASVGAGKIDIITLVGLRLATLALYAVPQKDFA